MVATRSVHLSKDGTGTQGSLCDIRTIHRFGLRTKVEEGQALNIATECYGDAFDQTMRMEIFGVIKEVASITIEIKSKPAKRPSSERT